MNRQSKIKLGEVYLDAVVEETPSHKAEVTDKPVERGVDISDHMKPEPATVRLSGTMVKDAASKLNILKRYQREAELLTYVGRNIYNNMVIADISTDHAVDSEKGYHYSISLRQVTISQPKTIKLKVHNPETKKKSPKTKSKVKKKTNVGRRQPRRKVVSTKTKKKINQLTVDRLSSSALGRLPKWEMLKK